MQKKENTPSRSQQQAQHPLGTNKLSIQGKSPYELAYMRRVCVREQKRLMITRKLEDELPVGYLMMHCVILWLLALLLVAIQIALIVYKSPLYYICSGFWVGAYFVFCSILVGFLIYRRTYNYLMSSFICNGVGIVISLGGIVVVNGMDLAIYNTSCIFDCDQSHQHQYLGLIQLVFGVCGIIVFALFVLIIEISILRESRKLNSYLENPPASS